MFGNMSKIGSNPITIPNSIVIELKGNEVMVKSGSNQSVIQLPKSLKAVQKENVLIIERLNENKQSKSLHGLYRQLIYNAVTGFEKPWQKRLEVVGTGYNVKLQGTDLIFRLGYSHQVTFHKVEGITYQVEGNNKVVISGSDKQLVGQVAYKVKMLKKPDAYKGKGIRYEGEQLRIKPGKKAKTAGAAA